MEHPEDFEALVAEITERLPEGTRVRHTHRDLVGNVTRDPWVHHTVIGVEVRWDTGETGSYIPDYIEADPDAEETWWQIFVIPRGGPRGFFDRVLAYSRADARHSAHAAWPGADIVLDD